MSLSPEIPVAEVTVDLCMTSQSIGTYGEDHHEREGGALILKGGCQTPSTQPRPPERESLGR